LIKVREHYFPGQGNPLASENSKKVIMACRQALRKEMKALGLSADSKQATK
jgi:phosphoheptose isomerase